MIAGQGAVDLGLCSGRREACVWSGSREQSGDELAPVPPPLRVRGSHVLSPAPRDAEARPVSC